MVSEIGFLNEVQSCKTHLYGRKECDCDIHLASLNVVNGTRCRDFYAGKIGRFSHVIIIPQPPVRRAIHSDVPNPTKTKLNIHESVTHE